MSKITLNSIADLTQSSTAQTTINSNSSVVQSAMDNTLSRDGTSPNQMGANLDMNSNQILNLPAPASVSSPARLQDVTNNPVILTVPPVGTSGATVPLLNANNTWSGINTYTQRQIYNYTPVFDLNTGTIPFSTNLFINPLASLSIPANKSLALIGLPSNATNIQMTLGAGATGANIWSNVEALSGSDATSNLYSGIFYGQNDGPGVVKALHVFSAASGSSTGVVYGGTFEVTPIATTTNAACVQAALIGNAGDGICVGYTINSSGPGGIGIGNQFIYGIGSIIGPVPIKGAFYQAWMGSTSAATARAFTTWNNAGSEIQYIKATGEVVSNVGLIAGTETNGIYLDSNGNLYRIPANGNLVIKAGTGAGNLVSIQTGGVERLRVSDSLLTVGTGLVSSNGSVATVLGSLGPAGSHTTVQGWLSINYQGNNFYIPFF